MSLFNIKPLRNGKTHWSSLYSKQNDTFSFVHIRDTITSTGTTALVTVLALA
ncbi:hypothetical protein [Niallia circulans]|uniref:hypothetical protein n=1 Tax=Niallia circulans TaxID=1397 RepID=UPI0013DDED8D|nr:hypothetical protein [Niallia circulans]